MIFKYCPNNESNNIENNKKLAIEKNMSHFIEGELKKSALRAGCM